jgi:DNA-binding transcriptional LysR family regulator
MDRWQAMRIFVKVAEMGGFSKAAYEMNTSAPVVTRAIAGLEQAIGARLLTRTTRAMKLTESGLRYVEDCRRILSDLEKAEAAAAGCYTKPAGTLTVTALPLFGQTYVLPILAEYLDKHSDMRANALFVERPVNLVEEGVDVAFCVGQLPDSRLCTLKVGSVRRVICGSPSYLSKYGVPSDPSDLKDHRVVISTAGRESAEWRFAGEKRVAVQPNLLCSTNEAALAAAKMGWGLTRVYQYKISDALLDGRLRIVLSEHEEPPLPIHVLYCDGRRAPAKVKTFLKLAVARLRANHFSDPVPALNRG